VITMPAIAARVGTNVGLKLSDAAIL